MNGHEWDVMVMIILELEIIADDPRIMMSVECASV